MRTTLLDIETSPNLAFVWGIWEQNISTSHIVDHSTVMCWSAKELGSDKVQFDSIYQSSHKTMLKGIHKLLDESDVVITYNGNRFDLPTLNKEFLLAGLSPPSPYKRIDLLKVAKYKFKFVSNKLDFVAQSLGVGTKTKHTGFQLWVDCLEKKPEAWKLMKEYNIQDTVLLEKVYNKMLPWIDNHPNQNVYNEVQGCTKCGSTSYQSRGTYKLTTGSFRKLQCNSCHGWFKGEKLGKTKVQYKEIV